LCLLDSYYLSFSMLQQGITHQWLRALHDRLRDRLILPLAA